MNNEVTNITILTGPTASGKTAQAIDIAKDKDGIIINADAMQLYDGLPILTAQPDAQEQASAPHHLYGSQHPNTHITAAAWRDLAISEITACEAAKKHPIFVGGTGFYIMALIKGLSPIPDIDLGIRDELNAYRLTRSEDDYFEEFQKLDPEMASRLEPQDTQRITRAWEVLKGTGKSLSEWQDLPRITAPDHYRFHVIVLQPDIETLNKRIRTRIDQMLEHGAMNEIETLTQRIDEGEVNESSLLVKAHGFRPFRSYLKGQWSLEEAIECTDVETRRYAKRQRTWGRNQYAIDKLPNTITFEHISV